MQNNTEIPRNEKNIVLIGFMGVGKTTIGQLVASALMRTFVDIDQEIEKQFNMSIPDIFKQMGESKFREAEFEVITQYCSATRLNIISLGGGAFLQEKVRDICLSTSIVFCLDLSFHAWKQRLDLLAANRPILHGKSLHEIEELYHNRQKIYAFHHYKINTDHLSAEQAAQAMIQLYNQ